MKKISMIIVSYNRKEVCKTINHNIEYFRDYIGEIIVICKSSDIASISSIKIKKEIKLIFITLDKEFNKSLCLNLGISQASYDYIMFIDSDVIITDFNINKALDILDFKSSVTLDILTDDQMEGYCIENPKIRSISFYASLDFFSSGKMDFRTNCIRFNPISRAGPGILLCKKGLLNKIQGFYSGFRGWGWEDIDILIRLYSESLLPPAYYGKGHHISIQKTEALDISDKENSYSESENRKIAICRYVDGVILGTLESDTLVPHDISVEYGQTES